jgi:metal-responsive CopG/Arc/MetJ family transcriptional regulator
LGIRLNVDKNLNRKESVGRSIALYLDNVTLNLLEKASKALNMNRSEFLRFCVLHYLDEANALQARVKEELLKSEA